MVSHDLVEREPGGAGLRLDDGRRSILASDDTRSLRTFIKENKPIVRK